MNIAGITRYLESPQKGDCRHESSPGMVRPFIGKAVFRHLVDADPVIIVVLSRLFDRQMVTVIGVIGEQLIYRFNSG